MDVRDHDQELSLSGASVLCSIGASTTYENITKVGALGKGVESLKCNRHLLRFVITSYLMTETNEIGNAIFWTIMQTEKPLKNKNGYVKYPGVCEHKVR